MLPIFLPPRNHDAFNDWSNIPLETAHTPLPTLHHPFQSIVPTFWACSTSTSRVSPQDASTLRLLVYLLRNWLEAMELVWDVSPDFLSIWSAQYRILTVYPLISALLTHDSRDLSAHGIAELAYRPLLTALQDSYSHTHLSLLNLTPLLCFVTGQFFSSKPPSLSDYPPDTLSLLIPRSLSPPQCELILRISRRWQSAFPHHASRQTAHDFAKLFTNAWYAEPEPPHANGYVPPTTRPRSH